VTTIKESPKMTPAWWVFTALFLIIFGAIFGLLVGRARDAASGVTVGAVFLVGASIYVIGTHMGLLRTPITRSVPFGVVAMVGGWVMYGVAGTFVAAILTIGFWGSERRHTSRRSQNLLGG